MHPPIATSAYAKAQVFCLKKNLRFNKDSSKILKSYFKNIRVFGTENGPQKILPRTPWEVGFTEEPPSLVGVLAGS
jgi:hypothetical protein